MANEAKRNTLVMTIEHEGGHGSTEVHMVNPGEVFEGFGGSRHALVPKKTASLVLRRKQFGVSDTEYDIFDKGVWQWIAKLINENGDEYKLTAKTPE